MYHLYHRQINAHFNNCNSMAIGVDNLGTGTVGATENWWLCSTGPTGKRCSTIVGSGVALTPWLTSPFDTNHY